MEMCSFQSQVLSVMEVLAKAAVTEINRQVDDRCAVIRVEVSQSRRDIDLLRRKCEVMEAELRRSRMRARRKGTVCSFCFSKRGDEYFLSLFFLNQLFCPPASERFSPLVKVVLNKETQSKDWDRQVDAEAPNQPQQVPVPRPALRRADAEPANEAEHMQIKEECVERDTWKNDPEDKLNSGAEQPPCFKASQFVQTDMFAETYDPTEDPADPGPTLSPANGYDTFPERQLNRNQSETKITVKHEKGEEPDENAAPLDSGHRFVTEESDDQLRSSRDTHDSSFSHAGQQFDQMPTVFTPQSCLHLPDMVPRSHSGLSAPRMKRRARTFGCERPQPDDGHKALSQINVTDQSVIPQQSQHPYRDSTLPDEDLMTPNPATSSFCGHSRSGFSLVRRMRTAWTSGIGEKRFSCTYCNKSFMRFSQLKEHLRSHTGEKPFSCLQCGRSFTKQCNLIRHAVVHSGEKPYECSLCGKCFTQRSSLKSHQKTAH
ncbi:zinc finger and BTB domain-containing protein 24 isoform X1 [Channa argus]|uniref:zinc finger and BTB domain-containing protein 24 isoform X1 n=1 Tax=Channa argus TaxID=215402 RepID=UPI003520E5DF